MRNAEVLLYEVKAVVNATNKGKAIGEDGIVDEMIEGTGEF